MPTFASQFWIAYATAKGLALIDREPYLPQAWK
jgi:hypothetical protein